MNATQNAQTATPQTHTGRRHTRGPGPATGSWA